MFTYMEGKLAVGIIGTYEICLLGAQCSVVGLTS